MLNVFHECAPCANAHYGHPEREIQVSEHSSVEDAKATMDVYKTAAKDWEKMFKGQRAPHKAKAKKGKSKF